MSNKGRTSKKGLVLLCLAFMGCGVYMWVEGLAAIKTGELIHNLSPTHAYSGYEAVAGGTICLIGGVVGIWVVLRSARQSR